jgi:mannose-6-phosphate isomerase-like protein (cupin superfamily)
MKADFQSLLAALPQPARAIYPLGTPFVSGMAHGSMQAELFAPACSGLGRDIQQPHTQDELYVVQGGRSVLCLRGERLQVQSGDLLFVPAGAPHHFEDFSPDFVTWVIFYGCAGGERGPNADASRSLHLTHHHDP